MHEPTLQLPPPLAHLYEQDFFLWTQAIADALRSGSFSQLDIEHLVEEVESLGRRDRREVNSRLVVLLHHLLKWEFQPLARSRSWKATLNEQRRRIRDILQDSPSLRSFLEDAIANAYQDARREAADETGLAMSHFPEHCPYTIAAILDVEFLPGAINSMGTANESEFDEFDA